MPTHRGFLTASLAKLALIAPFLAQQAIAGDIEARTVEVVATTYLELGHCQNACTTKKWHEWETPGHESPPYATHTMPAKEGCVTTSISTKHPECQKCRGTVYVYVPKTEHHKKTTTVTKSVPTSTQHTTKPTTVKTSSKPRANNYKERDNVYKEGVDYYKERADNYYKERADNYYKERADNHEDMDMAYYKERVDDHEERTNDHKERVNVHKGSVNNY
ncbi:hypothetical protein VCV18_000097 [Metarhizium anisopliae]